jgi:hypothetical protein
VGLLLAELEELDLGVSQHADDVSMLLEAGKLVVDVLVRLIGHAARIAVERFLLRTVPRGETKASNQTEARNSQLQRV